MKTRFLLVICSVSLFFAIASAYLLRWNRAIYNAIPFLCGITGITLALVTLLKIWLSKTKATLRQGKVEQARFLVSIFLMIQFIYFPFSSMFVNLEIEHAKVFAEALIPKLEEYKNQHKAYPEELSKILPVTNSFPSLLRLSGSLPNNFDNRDFYWRQDRTYSFHFYLPDGFIGFTYNYCCGANGSWTITD